MGEAFLSPSLNAFPLVTERRLRSSQGMDKLKKFNFQLILFPKTDIPENCLLAADFFSTHLLSHNCSSPILPKKDPTFSSAAVFPLTKALKKNKKMGGTKQRSS